MSCLLQPLRLAIDAGHGGRDPGTVGFGHREKDIALAYTLTLMKELRARGHEPRATRVQDEDLAPEADWPNPGKALDLNRRALMANAYGATAFVSLHVNSSVSAAARGAWVLHHHSSVAGKALAERVYERLRFVPGTTEGTAVYPDGEGWTSGRTLAVLRKTRMPAILVELGFLTHPFDRQLLTKQPGHPPLIARAIADGIEDWVRLDA